MSSQFVGGERKKGGESTTDRIEIFERNKRIKVISFVHTHIIFLSLSHRDVLSNVVQQQEIQQQKQVQLQTKLLVESTATGSQRPDLLTAAHYDILGRDSPSPSLHDEIVATERNTSPVLRYECTCTIEEGERTGSHKAC